LTAIGEGPEGATRIWDLGPGGSRGRRRTLPAGVLFV